MTKLVFPVLYLEITKTNFYYKSFFKQAYCAKRSDVFKPLRCFSALTKSNAEDKILANF